MNQEISQVSDIALEVKNGHLNISYFPLNGNAMYDLCSLEGRILITGKLESAPGNSIDLNGYPSGMYNLFILDGDKVFKNTFRL